MAFCTVVSMFPGLFNEFKPGLVPSRYIIPKPADGDFTLLFVSDAVDRIYLDDIRGNLSVPVPAAVIAKSLVDDFIVAQPGISPGAAPGIFWVEGKFSKEEIREKFDVELAEAERSQNLWGLELVKAADDDWGKYKRHRTITDMQRHFARLFGLEREWTIATPDEVFKKTADEATSSSKCKFCTTTIPNEAVVCPNCRNILDTKRFKALLGED